MTRPYLVLLVCLEMSSWLGLMKLVPVHAIVVLEHHSLRVPTSYCSPSPLHPLWEYPQGLSCMTQGALAVPTVMAVIRGLERKQPAQPHKVHSLWDSGHWGRRAQDPVPGTCFI